MADVRIRRAEPADADAITESFAGPKSFGGTLQLPFPSRVLWQERLAKPDPDGVLLVAEARPADASEADYAVVASLGLHPAGPSPRRRHALFLGMSVRDDWQGHGIGTALLRAAIDRADNWMNVTRIELTVFVDNPVAIALYQRFGFVVEGTHRAYALRDGAYVDALAMARLHPRPPVLPTS